MSVDDEEGWRQLPMMLESDGSEWSIAITSMASDGTDLRRVSLHHNASTVLSTASVGKLVLLAEVAHGICDGGIDPTERLVRTSAEAVSDSGIWQYLDANALTIHDAAVLVSATSDNLATNVLLRRIGLDRLTTTTARLGLGTIELHDYVRDHRGPSDPSRLSSGSAVDLSRLFARIGSGALGSPEVSGMLSGWLALNTDLSMVASAFDLDPLAHTGPSTGVSLINKTGTDDGVRADCGLVSRDSGQVAYAAIANWEPANADERAAVMRDMRAIGVLVRHLSDQLESGRHS